MILNENMATTRKMYVKGKDRIEYIKNASQTVSEAFSAHVDRWIVDLLVEDEDALELAASELASGNESQWEECVSLWEMEVEL